NSSAWAARYSVRASRCRSGAESPSRAEELRAAGRQTHKEMCVSLPIANENLQHSEIIAGRVPGREHRGASTYMDGNAGVASPVASRLRRDRAARGGVYGDSASGRSAESKSALGRIWRQGKKAQ